MSGKDKGRRLGNDPFQRGAAAREPAKAPDEAVEAVDSEATGEETEPATPRTANSGAAKKKAAAKKAPAKKAPSKKTAARKAPAKRPAAKKPAAKQTPAAPKPRAKPRPPEAPERTRAAVAAAEADTGETQGVPAWLRAAATTAYDGTELLDQPPAAERAAGGPAGGARIPEPLPPDDGLGAVRAAGMGGAAFDVGDELARTVGGLERALRSLLGPGLAADVQEALTEVAELARRTFVGASARRRAEMVPRPSTEYDEFGLDRTFETRVRPVFARLFERYFRVDVRGIENIPASGRTMLVCNHSGALPYDGAMVKTAVELRHPSPRPVRPLVEDFVFHFPFLGTFMNRYGGVRACPENAERLLEHEALVAVFPEGLKGLGKLYRERYQLQRFGRGGFVKLALRTHAPIVPVAIVGAEEIHPLLAKITFLVRPLGIPYIPITPTFPLLGPLGLVPLPSKWTIAFGEPVDLSRYGAEAANDRILVNRLAESIRSRIQTMVDGLLEERRGVFRG